MIVERFGFDPDPETPWVSQTEKVGHGKVFYYKGILRSFLE